MSNNTATAPELGGVNKTDPTAPLYQATVTGTGRLPNDSQIDDAAIGPNTSDDGMAPVNIAYDRAQQDLMVDGPPVPYTPGFPAPPPGSYTGHTDISEDQSLPNMLSDRRYSMLRDD